MDCDCQQTLGHAGTQTAHGHALLWAIAQASGRRSGHLGQHLRGHTGGNGAGCRRSWLGTTGHSRQHVTLGHAAVLARTSHIAYRQIVVGQQLGCCRHGHIGLGTTGDCSGGGHRCSSGCRGGCSCRSSCTRLTFGVNAGDQLLSHDGSAVALNNLRQHARRRCRHFQHHLVCFDFDQDFIGSDGLACFFLPRQHGGFGHGFGQLRDFDFYDSHINSFGNGVCSDSF